MTDLLKLAQADLNASIQLHKLLKTTTDEMYLGICSYHIQQCIEKILKYLILLQEIEPPKTHSITRLIDLAENNAITVPQILSDNAEVIEKWATESRYNSEFYISLKKFEHVKTCTEKWMEEIKSHQTPTIPVNHWDDLS